MKVHAFWILMFIVGICDVAFGRALEEQRTELSSGIRVAYIETGKADGEPVLFLHGFTDTKRSFYLVSNQLSQLRPDLRLILMDFRGHGGSTMPSPAKCGAAPEECFRIKDFADDVIAFLDQMKISRTHIVGHSLGSLVAQEVALVNPNRVNKLVLIASGVRGVGNPIFRDFLLSEHLEGSWKSALVKKKVIYPNEIYSLTILDADPNGKEWLSKNWVVDPLAEPKFLSEILADTARIPLGVWLGFVRNFLQWDISERLKDLKVETLVIWASQDNIFPESDQKLLLASLNAASQRHKTKYYWKQYGKKPLPASGVQEDDAGHNTHWGMPDSIAADIASFLRSDGIPVRNLPHASKEHLHKILTEGTPIILEGPQQ